MQKIALAGLMLVAASALADEKQDYPLALVDRPITLAARMVEPMLAVDIGGGSNVDVAAGITVGADFGVLSRLQLGISTSFPVTPSVTFGTVTADAIIRLHHAVGLRFDAGYNRVSSLAIDMAGNVVDSATATFIGGIGVPIRLKLARWFAFTSGSTTAGMGLPTQYGPGQSHVLFEGPTINSTDVVTIVANGDAQIFALYVPVGILFQPIRFVGLNVRSGYRIEIARNSQATSEVHYVPIGLDLIGSPFRQLDVGYTFDLAGPVAVTGAGSMASLDYDSLWAMRIWVKGRF